MMSRKLSLVAVAMLVAIGLVVSCSSSPEKKEGKLVTEQGPVPRYLEQIPAETPYVFAALEPMPLQNAMSFIEEIGKFYDDTVNSIKPMMQREGADPDARKVLAVLEEFQGKISREGLQSLGFEISPRMAMYGIGPLPVFRMDLGDPKAFESFLGRLEEKGGFTAKVEKRNGIAYRTYQVEDVVFPVAVIGEEVVVGMSPRKARDSFLPYMLGEKKTETSYADDNRVEELIQTYDFKPFGAGFVDIEGIASMMLAGSDDLNAEILAALEYEPPQLSETCRTEYLQMAETAPRVVVGYDEFSETSVGGRFGLELTNDLGTQLAATQRPVPALDTPVAEDSLLAVGLGFHVGEVLQVVRQRAMSIRDNPYKCDDLGDINKMAGEVAMFLQMAPPVVSSVEGASVVLKDVTFEQQTTTAPSSAPPGAMDTMREAGPPIRLHGVGFIRSEDPTSLWQSLGMLQPQLANVSVKPNGEPAAIPPIPGLEMLPNLKVAMTKDTIGLSSGEGMVVPMSETLEAGDPGTAKMIVMSYDYGAIMKTVSKSLPPDPNLQSLTKMLDGETRVMLEPKDDGIFVSASQSFNQPPPQR